MADQNRRIAREKKTVGAMITLYCRRQHGVTVLCAECGRLLEYALLRLDKCPFQEGKTTCAKCPAHCYSPPMRDRVKTAMRYSGPRMIYRHPVMACRHLIDARRKKPLRTQHET